MNPRMFRCSLVAMISSLIPPFLGAQVRFFDRMQTQPQGPSRWETVIQQIRTDLLDAGGEQEENQFLNALDQGASTSPDRRARFGLLEEPVLLRRVEYPGARDAGSPPEVTFTIIPDFFERSISGISKLFRWTGAASRTSISICRSGHVAVSAPSDTRR